MNIKRILPLALFLITVGFSFSVSAQTNEIQDRYMDFLYENNIAGKIDDDGDVQFKYNDKTFFFRVIENNPLIFDLVLMNVWSIDSESERLEVLRAVNYANREVMHAKTFTYDDKVWVRIEDLMAASDDFESYFEKAMVAIEECLDLFVEAMNN